MEKALAKAQILLDQEHPNPDKAIQILKPLLDEGGHWLAWYFMGIAHMQKSEFEQAVNSLEESISRDAEHPQTYLMAARCYAAMADFKLAERYGKAAIQLDQNLLDGWLLMGGIYEQLNELDKAVQCYSIANKLDPKDHEVVYSIAKIYELQGKNKQALHLYEIILRMKPDFAVARERKDELYINISSQNGNNKPKFIHLCFNHLYAKSLSDLLSFVNEESDQKHLLYVETHWAIEHYQPDFSKDEHVAWFNHKNDLQSIINACLEPDVEAVFAHGLFYSWQKEIITSIGAQKHIGWIIWGGDLYNPLKVKSPIYDIVEHVDSILSLVPGDVSVFRETYGERPAYRFGYPYPGLYGAKPVVQEKAARPIIVVGNSGDYSNNHIDILEVLRKKKDIFQYDILLPVSYNLIPEYEEAILRWVKVAGLTDMVKLEKEFIDPEKYQQLISSSSMLITAHNRQQAIGNNLLSIYSGNPTILKKYIEVNGRKQLNPTWKMLSDYGLNVYSFEKFRDAKTVTSVSQKSEKEILRQQQIITDEFGLQTRAEDLIKASKSILQEKLKPVNA
ncbi:MAG: hypothetical protein CL670_08615 [Balneola sp.]|nr:hypothetical protein [Balneola sp.]MBE79201.1 hypothetical protein [Balneola sp.]HAD53309.1 hypothetical protein [Algoriphagus sp.]